MPGFKTEVPTPLAKEDAIGKLEGFLDGVKEKYKDQVSDMRSSWTDNQLDFAIKTYGFEITGKVTVEDKRVLLEGNLPMTALPFRGKIEQSFASELAKALKE